MSKIQIFDPSLCCSTGVCGVEVDQQLVNFAADVDWARQNGAQIDRFNLAQQPQSFAADPVIRQLLEAQGESALPAVVVDGRVKLSGGYPSRQQLAEWAGVARTTPVLSVAAINPVAAGGEASPSACCGPRSGQAAATTTKCC